MRRTTTKLVITPPNGARHPPWLALVTFAGTCCIFNEPTLADRKFCRREPMRQSASGADWRAMRTAAAAASAARPDLASRGRGCGNRLRRNTRHENNRNSECTSEARRDAVGASETRINTRLFTYGVRAQGGVAGRGAIACNPRAAITACTSQIHPNSN
jgi:hypothetical protein